MTDTFLKLDVPGEYVVWDQLGFLNASKDHYQRLEPSLEFPCYPSVYPSIIQFPTTPAVQTVKFQNYRTLACALNGTATTTGPQSSSQARSPAKDPSTAPFTEDEIKLVLTLWRTARQTYPDNPVNQNKTFTDALVEFSRLLLAHYTVKSTPTAVSPPRCP